MKNNLTLEKFQEVFGSNDPNLKFKLGYLCHRYLFEGVLLQDEEMMQLCIDSAQELKHDFTTIILCPEKAKKIKVLIEQRKHHGFEHLITHAQNTSVENYYESQKDNHKRIFNYLTEVKVGDGQKPYCPFVKMIERSNGYYFKCFTIEGLTESFYELERGFKSISPDSTRSDQKPDPLTIIAAFPEQKAMSENFCKLLEQKRNELRLGFLIQGLMVAHMHPFHSLGSAKEASNFVHEELYVSNIPLLMVRRMHKEDIVFMHTEDELNAYYSFFPKENFLKCPFRNFL